MFANAVVTVTTTPTRLCTPGPRGALLQNLGAAILYVGGPTVTANAAATGGVQLPANQPSAIFVPTGVEAGTVGDDQGLYGRVASGSVNVAVLAVA